MFSKLNRDQRDQMIMLYALLCSDQDASTEFLNRVGSGLGSKSEEELRAHYRACLADYLLRIERKKGGLIS